jgi:hypothetical protein
MSSRLIKLPLPGTSLFSVKVMVPMDKVDLGKVSTHLVAGTRKLKDLKWGMVSDFQGADDYLYTMADDPEEEGGQWYLPMYFGPDRNSGAAPAMDATPDHTFEDIEEYDWPPVLTNWVMGAMFSGSYVGSNPMVMSYNGNNQIVYVDGETLIIARWDWKDGMHVPTRHTVKQWWSPVKWDFNDITGVGASARRFDRMHPTSVRWDIHYDRGSVPPCLHEEILVPGLFEDRSALGFANINLVAQTIAATKFTDWEDHVVKDGQSFVKGMYLREQWTAHVPHNTTYTA